MSEIDYGRMDAIEAALGGRAAVQAAYESGGSLVGGGGGGATIAIAALGDQTSGQYTVASDANPQGNNLFPSGSPPAWLVDGSITESGLYVVSVQMLVEPGSSTGAHVRAKGPFGSEYVVSLDGMAALLPPGEPVSLPDIGALGAGDLPFSVVGSVQMESAAASGGWLVAFRLQATRLIAAAS